MQKYTEEQKQAIVAKVDELHAQGMSASEAIKKVGTNSWSYNNWKHKSKKAASRKRVQKKPTLVTMPIAVPTNPGMAFVLFGNAQQVADTLQTLVSRLG